MFPKKKIATGTLVAYAFGLRRRQNGKLIAADMQREFAKDYLKSNLFILGDNLKMAEVLLNWAESEDRSYPRSLSYEEMGVAVQIIADYERTKQRPSVAQTVGGFPIAVGKRGMLKARILSIKERNKAGGKVFANGKTWITTSHIEMEVSKPDGDERAWRAVWYATGGRETLSDFWRAYHEGETLVVMATVRDERDFRPGRPVNLTRVRLASVKQLAEFQRRLDKVAALQDAQPIGA